MELVVWGTGAEYSRNKDQLSGFTYRIVDSSEEKQGLLYDGIKVESPNILLKYQYDIVVIASSLYFTEIYERLMNQYCVQRKNIIPLHDARKELLMRDIGRYKLQKCEGARILFGYCFLIYENCRIHDYLLAESLRLRGAEIIPVACGGAQECQCSFYGGVWGNNTHDIDEKIANHRRNCENCKGCDEKVWEYWGNYNITFASDYLTEKERRFAKEYIQKLEINSVNSWEYDDFPIGSWGLKVYFNLELISHKHSWTSVEEKEFKFLVYNVMIMCIASLKIVEKIKPDIIYSNDSFYYPFSILEAIAKKKGIPFYNAYGFRRDTYTYAMDASTLSMKNLDSAWKTFSQQKLNNEENKFISEYVLKRRYGADMLLNTADPFQSVREIRSESVYGLVDNKKKTALLATNVTWDAAALGRGIVFENTIDWVMYTIDWFAGSGEWQLIVRTHPAEINQLIPEARERICSIVLKRYHNKLPENIVLIDGDAPISIYDLLNIVDLGIVYTSTVGLEMCCNGIPTIVVADAPYREKGFTYDPSNVGEYINQLEEIMEKPLSNEKKKKIEQQAKKFFLLYYFIYMLPNSFYKFTYEQGAKMIIERPEDLILGKNQIWDYICESILEKKAIISENRIPPHELKI